MGRWRRQQGGIHHQEAQGPRSQNRKPPLDSRQASVPPWEKKFCAAIGLVPWQKLLDTKKCMYLYDNVVQWNDSAGEEAFHNAKNRFWAEINGLPCDISLPDPDIYIDEVDWNSRVDPELWLDLEREPKAVVDEDKEEKTLIVHDPLPLNQSFPCSGWGDAEEDLRKATDLPCTGWGYENRERNVDNNDNPWEHNNTPNKGAMQVNGWGNHRNDSWGQWENGCNGWENNYNINGGRSGGYWGTWDDYNRNKEGSERYTSRYKTSRFHGSDHRMGHGWRNGREWRRVNVAYE